MTEMKIIKLDTVVSTQDEIKKYLDEVPPIAVLAAEQTGGRGTKGRAFSSAKGGVYASFIIGFKDIKADKAHLVLERLSLAVIKTLEEFGAEAAVKWPNDIFVCGKKICGMLIENVFAGGNIEKTVAGIGINVNNELPDELKDIAISLKQVLGRSVDTLEVFDSLCKNIVKDYPEGLYKKYSMVIGKKITVSKGGESYSAVATDLTEDGRLVLSDGEILSFEEISLKIQ